MTRVVSAPAKPQPQVATAKPQGGPSQEQIARRAYEKWLKSGRSHGNHEKDWLEAEAELRREMTGAARR